MSLEKFLKEIEVTLKANDKDIFYGDVEKLIRIVREKDEAINVFLSAKPNTMKTAKNYVILNIKKSDYEKATDCLKRCDEISDE